jgi:glycosyltransferase involved in cell wall biosynthesis
MNSSRYGSGLTTVSIVTPAYNMGEMLEQAMESIRRQTYRPLEHVIVDDGSTDDTAERVERFDYGDVKVRLISVGMNKGAGNATHIGFSEAKGEYISFLAADDLMIDPNKTKKQIELMKSKDADWSYYRDFYSGPDIQTMRHKKPSYLPPLYSFNRFFERNPYKRLTALMFRNPINFSSVMIKKQCIDKYGQIDPITRNVDGDADLLLRYTALNLTLAVANGAPIFYRDHPRQTSKNRPLMVKGSEMVRTRLLTILSETGMLLKYLKKSTIVLIAFLSTNHFLVYPSTDRYLCDFILKNRNSFNWLLVRVAARAKKKVDKVILSNEKEQTELETRIREALTTDVIKVFKTQLENSINGV